MSNNACYSVSFNPQSRNIINQALNLIESRQYNPKLFKNLFQKNGDNQNLLDKIMSLANYIKSLNKREQSGKVEDLLSRIAKIIECFIKHQEKNVRSNIDGLQGQLKNNLIIFSNRYFHSCICLQKSLQSPFNKYIDNISSQISTKQQIKKNYFNLTNPQQEYFYIFNTEIQRLKQTVDQFKKINIKYDSTQCDKKWQRIPNDLKTKLQNSEAQKKRLITQIENNTQKDYKIKCERLQLQLIRKQQGLRTLNKQLEIYNESIKKCQNQQRIIKNLKLQNQMFKDQTQKDLQNANKIIEQLTQNNQSFQYNLELLRKQKNNIQLKLLDSKQQNQTLLNELNNFNHRVSDKEIIQLMKVNQTKQKRNLQGFQKLYDEQKKFRQKIELQLYHQRQQLRKSQSQIKDLLNQQQQLANNIVQLQNKVANSWTYYYNDKVVGLQELKAIIDENKKLKETIDEKKIIYDHMIKTNDRKNRQNQNKKIQLQMKISQLQQIIQKDAVNYQKGFNQLQILKNRQQRLKQQLRDIKLKLQLAQQRLKTQKIDRL